MAIIHGGRKESDTTQQQTHTQMFTREDKIVLNINMSEAWEYSASSLKVTEGKILEPGYLNCYL